MVTTLQEMIQSQKWALAYEKALALIAGFSTIEYGHDEDDGKKFTEWFSNYVIKCFDELVKDYTELEVFKLKERKISKNSLQSISIGGMKKVKTGEWENCKFDLSKIIYQIRCTDFHTQSRIMQYVKINNLNAVFTLRVDENNVFEQSDNNIYLCPHFFTILILCSLKQYEKSINSKTVEIQKRYSEFAQFNLNSVFASLIPASPIEMSVDCKINVSAYAYIHTNDPIKIEEDSFTAERPKNFIQVFYSQIKDFKTISSNDTQVLKVAFDDAINNFGGLLIDLEHSRLSDLVKEIINKRSN